MTDRLAEIKGTEYGDSVRRDIDWLIQEVERLRAAADEYAKSLGLEPVRPGENIEDWLGRSETELDPNVKVQPDLKLVEP